MSQNARITNVDLASLPTTEPVNYDATAVAALRNPNASTVKIIPKPPQSAIIPHRKAQLLRKIGNAQAEIGRLNKLLDEIRAEVLHLTVE